MDECKGVIGADETIRRSMMQAGQTGQSSQVTASIQDQNFTLHPVTTDRAEVMLSPR